MEKYSFKIGTIRDEYGVSCTLQPFHCPTECHTECLTISVAAVYGQGNTSSQ